MNGKPKISKEIAVVRDGWIFCPVTWAKIGAVESGATGKGIAPYCKKCGVAHPVEIK